VGWRPVRLSGCGREPELCYPTSNRSPVLLTSAVRRAPLRPQLAETTIDALWPALSTQRQPADVPIARADAKWTGWPGRGISHHATVRAASAAV